MNIERLRNHLVMLSGPLSSGGKARFKSRDSVLEFGESFATRKRRINESVYLELQIGYDRLISDMDKQTSLEHLRFVGANRRVKNPYELPEIIHCLVQEGLLSIPELTRSRQRIIRNTFLLDDEFEIHETFDGQDNVNGIHFAKTHIQLPTFKHTQNDLTIEISIQKQQFGTGTQPMLYFCVPITRMSNSHNLLGRMSRQGDEWELIIDRDDAIFFLTMVEAFGICSESHKHDILEILELLIDDLS